MISIPLTPDQFAALTGDEGTITKMGVTASYRYADAHLQVAILEKPFFVTTEYCEEQIKAWFAAH